MKRMRIISLTALAAVLIALFSILSPALAGTGRTTDSGVVSSKPISQAESQAAAKYWTPARMAAAKPATPTLSGSPGTASSSNETASAGPAVSVAPSAATGANAAPAAKAQPPITLAATSVPRPYTNYPDRLNGKVFFTAAAGGNFVCSGTVVNSTNKSVVWTAGHCVHAGGGGRFHRNWTFVPAYSSSFNGQRPYGTWTARTLSTRTEWAVNSNFRQDLGAAVLNPLNGQLIVNRLGGQGIRFNVSRNQSFSAFGYPAEAPFNGLLQWRCNSPRVADDFPPGVGPATLKINCNMTGGASGGGWLINLSGGLGFVNGLNSYKYNNAPDFMFGPYHGSAAQSLYNSVQNL